MLTGDTHAAADHIARAAGIEEVHAGLLPQDKLSQIRAFQAEGRSVAMVGDGINDAAALAQADAGLAIGTGTDLAREAGDAILLRGDPAQIVAALSLARQTLRVMRQNLGWALGYNLLGIPIAAGVALSASRTSAQPGRGRCRDGSQLRQRADQQPAPEALHAQRNQRDKLRAGSNLCAS